MSAPESTAITIDFTALLLGILGFTDGEHVSIGYTDETGVFHTDVMAAASAPRHVDQLPSTANIYFGVNPTRGPARSNAGRGGDADVTRLAAVVCDLDIKPGGCPDGDTIHAIVADLSAILGTRPSVTVYSGHGLHAYWPIDNGQIHNGDNHRTRALARRFGRLVAVVAGQRGAKVDNVSDLARMLRVPGSTNNKTAGNGERAPVVVALADQGGPLTVEEAEERLTEVGILEEIGDAEPVSMQPISEPDTWQWAETTCEYVRAIVAGLATDGPSPGAGRHPWLLKQTVRLACAHRLGCITEADYRAAQQLLAQRFIELLKGTAPQREPQKYEIWGAWKWGVDRAAAKTEVGAGKELGGEYGHDHGGEQPPAAQPGTAAPPTLGRTITWSTASQIEDGVPEWAWEYDGTGCLMRATLALFAGRPAAGKSTDARWFAARFSTGTLPGCFYGQPQHVAYIASEESIEYIVKPSLRAHGADLDRIHFPKVEMDGQEVRLLSILDEAALTADLLAMGVTAVFVDPVMSAIGTRADIYRSNEARAYIEPWSRIAAAINGLVGGVVHLTKAPNGDIVAAINGSSAFGEVARAVIAFTKDPESESGERVLSQEKNSAGNEDLALTYKIESTFVTTDGGVAEVGHFVIGGPSSRRVGDVLRADTAKKRLGARSWEVLKVHLDAAGPIGPEAVAASIFGLSKDDAGQYQRRLEADGLLIKVARGLFASPEKSPTEGE